MHLYKKIREDVISALNELTVEKKLPAGISFDAVTAEPPRDSSHGDAATNAAMVLAKPAAKNPRELAETIKEKLTKFDYITGIEIAGPGFINLKIAPALLYEVIREVLREGVNCGDSKIGGGEKINVEYVSANPTGPMHVGHVRGAVIGDALAHLLTKVGYDVTREYYFNDAGVQVDVLARTTHLRYREALGENIGNIPEGLYPGEYLKEVGAALAGRDGKKWFGKPESEWLEPLRKFSVALMMEMIRTDLNLIGIHHDVFTNERELIENGTLEKAFKILDDKGLIYVGTLPPPRGKEMHDWEPVPLTLFRSTAFGDSTDRPLKKRDGSWTYFMPDIAYHYDKIRRGFALMINILGTDHGGYQERMQPVVTAFSSGEAKFKVIFNNMVKVFKNGEPVKLSKRSGNFITLREMVEEVGAGAVRFFMLTRDPKSPLDFDFAKVVEQSKDNPVFYVQYASARAHSVLRKIADKIPEKEILAVSEKELSLLKDEDEIALIKVIAEWPRIVESAAIAYEPHRIAFYLQALAAGFHGLWNKGTENSDLRFFIEDNIPLSKARGALVKAFAITLSSGLLTLSVQPVEEM